MRALQPDYDLQEAALEQDDREFQAGLINWRHKVLHLTSLHVCAVCRAGLLTVTNAVSLLMVMATVDLLIKLLLKTTLRKLHSLILGSLQLLVGTDQKMAALAVLISIPPHPTARKHLAWHVEQICHAADA